MKKKDASPIELKGTTKDPSRGNLSLSKRNSPSPCTSDPGGFLFFLFCTSSWLLRPSVSFIVCPSVYLYGFQSILLLGIFALRSRPETIHQRVELTISGIDFNEMFLDVVVYRGEGWSRMRQAVRGFLCFHRCLCFSQWGIFWGAQVYLHERFGINHFGIGNVAQW